ncbi:MAG: thiamine phosphate synthase [Ramlibacter sp.]
MPDRVRHDSLTEVLELTQALARAGLQASATPQDLARALRAAGAQAVLVVGETTWLDTPHASGFVATQAAPHLDTVAQRWREFLVQGFVAADAALLALWTGEGPLPVFTWGERKVVPVIGTLPDLGLYAIVDTVPRLRQVLQAGIRTVQLRIKEPRDADASWFAALRSSLREGAAASRDATATLVVNDHWRIAADVGAPAVHLGQEDLGRMTVQELTELAASRMALGVSSHAVWELARARTLAPAYIACGPVWPTTTKDMPWRPQGLDNLGWWCRNAQHPVAAIGGILSAEQVREAARAGANSVCVVRGLGDDPRQVVPALQDAFAQGRAEHDAGTIPRLPHPSLEPTA